MSSADLYAIELATTELQTSEQQSQSIFANTTAQASQILMSIYQSAETALQNKVKSAPSTGSGNSNQINEWETQYNELSEQYQITENTWNSPIQSLNTQEQSLATDQQMLSQFATDAMGVESYIATLLQSPM